MSQLYHDTFDSQTQCEEIYTTDPAEYDEVMSLMAESEEFEGYGEWSEQVEAQAWAGAVEVETAHGPVMVKPECDRTGAHKACTIYRCTRAHRKGGFDL